MLDIHVAEKLLSGHYTLTIIIIRVFLPWEEETKINGVLSLLREINDCMVSNDTLSYLSYFHL